MSSSTHVYTTESIEQPVQVQQEFASHYNLQQDPLAAITEYARNMHHHTQRQMERACRRSSGSRSSRRGVPNGATDAVASQQTSTESMNSF